jgi:hypothetical protein
MARLRISELETTFTKRYGRYLPDDDAGRADLELLLHHVTRLGTNAMSGSVRRWAPWLSERDEKVLIERIASSPKDFFADPLAELLNLTMQERTELKIRTIGAVDMTKLEREELAKRRKVEQKKDKRRANGVLSREEYEAQSLTRLKPWAAMGISRSTYYRQGRHLAEAA